MRALVDFTEDTFDKRRLQELCSKQGSDDFAKFIREPNLSLLDILTAFPSCKPPIDVIFGKKTVIIGMFSINIIVITWLFMHSKSLIKCRVIRAE